MLVRCNHWEDGRWLELPHMPLWADQVQEKTEDPRRSDLETLCQAIIKGYEVGKCGMDDDMLSWLICLGDSASEILHLVEVNKRATTYELIRDTGQASDFMAVRAGVRIAEYLGVQVNRDGWYPLPFGSKTAAGLARTVLRAIDEA